MKFTGGTPKALALIKKLKASGNLIDIYDRERLKSLKAPELLDLAMMDLFDKQYGTDYHHHLLVIFVDDGVDGDELISVYPPFAEKFNDKVFKPTLIFINLATQQIYTVSRVRKGGILTDFVPHPSGISDIDSVERLMYIDEGLSDRARQLEKMDYAKVMLALTGSLEQLADADYNLVYRDIDSGHIQEMLSNGPNQEGYYMKPTLSDDEELLSQEELDEAIEEISDYEYQLSSSIELFSSFFSGRQINIESFAGVD